MWKDYAKKCFSLKEAEEFSKLTTQTSKTVKRPLSAISSEQLPSQKKPRRYPVSLLNLSDEKKTFKTECGMCKKECVHIRPQLRKY